MLRARRRGRVPGSSTERNRMLYRRFGFDVIEELNWPGGGPPFWRMWRPAP